ncbi:hypothetical protein BDA96_02G013100 [Sorghum bicolor]|uniref:Uncharacterized protein n=1 Tax=Sorghum bicolor TaxID=4558 RepID=A0A921RLR3_SORBI|nr:hypothetical protein BDA96_02G013100 [Sorghum bicolor]
MGNRPGRRWCWRTPATHASGTCTTRRASSASSSTTATCLARRSISSESGRTSCWRGRPTSPRRSTCGGYRSGATRTRNAGRRSCATGDRTRRTR